MIVAINALVHKLACACCHTLREHKPFDVARCFAGVVHSGVPFCAEPIGQVFNVIGDRRHRLAAGLWALAFSPSARRLTKRRKRARLSP